MPSRVTVLIVTCNDEPFVGAAIESVLAQTFTDFEVVVVDDASTDRSREVAATYAARDARIRPIANREDLGTGPSRNRGLAAIASEYVAELDGNDVCMPERLAEQVAYLDAHPDVALVGSQATLGGDAAPNAGARPRHGSRRRCRSRHASQWASDRPSSASVFRMSSRNRSRSR